MDSKGPLAVPKWELQHDMQGWGRKAASPRKWHSSTMPFCGTKALFWFCIYSAMMKQDIWILPQCICCLFFLTLKAPYKPSWKVDNKLINALTLIRVYGNITQSRQAGILSSSYQRDICPSKQLKFSTPSLIQHADVSTSGGTGQCERHLNMPGKPIAPRQLQTSPLPLSQIHVTPLSH